MFLGADISLDLSLLSYFQNPPHEYMDAPCDLLTKSVLEVVVCYGKAFAV